MSFLSLSSELTGRLAGLPPPLADTFINRAWRDIRRERQWSFLMDVGAIVCPVQATAGAVAFVQFGTTVTCNAAASAALATLLASMPSPLDLTAVQIRFGGSGNAAAVGQVYSISAQDITTPTAYILTVDRPIVQATNATSGYQVYRAYIKPPVDDFMNWVSFVDMTNGWALRKNFTSSYFDLKDPQRQAQGQSYYVGAFEGNPGTDPRPQYELWPHPTSGQVFFTRFRRAGADFATDAEELPPIIPDSLVMERALGYHGYRWAAENVGRIPELKGPNYAQLMLEARNAYTSLLVAAKREDNEQQLNDIWARGHGLIHGDGRGIFKGMVNYPIDSNFMQSHLINF